MNRIYGLIADAAGKLRDLFSGGGFDQAARLRRLARAEGVRRLATAILADALILACLSVSAVYCFITAFSLPLSMTSAVGRNGRGAAVVIPIAAASALFVLMRLAAARWRTATCLQALITALVGLLMLKKIFYSACTVISIVTRAYSTVFGTSVIIPEGTDKNVPALYFALFTGLLLAALWQGAVIYGGFNGFEITLLAVLIAPCLVIKGHTPAPWAAVMLAASLCAAVMSVGAKRGSIIEGGTASAKLLLPVLALSLLPFLTQPPERYDAGALLDRIIDRTSEIIQEQAEKKPSESGFMNVVDDIVYGGRFSVDTETDMSIIRDAGPRRLSGRSVMDVRSTFGGLLYLRGASLAVYYNGSWEAADTTELENDPELARLSDRLPGYTAGGMPGYGTVDIKTDSEMNVLYTPYYYLPPQDQGAEIVISDGGTVTVDASGTLGEGRLTVQYGIEDGEGADAEFSITPDAERGASGEHTGDSYIENTEGVTEYGFVCRLPSASVRELDASDYSAEDGIEDFGEGGKYSEFAKRGYMNIPPDIRPELEKIARDNGLFDYSREDAPFAVAEYVRNSARYDLNTPAALKGEEFVLWFLEQSRSGYCVHFATAAAMLLRTVGIPSRYVTGYVVYAENGKWIHVTSDDAHAWVEYYVDGVGWLPLEATAYSSGGAIMPATSNSASTTTADTTAATSPTTGTRTASGADAPVSGADNTAPDKDGNGKGTSPDPNGSGTGEGQGKGGGRLRAWLAVILITAGAAGAVFLRRYLELRRREALYARGGADCALQIWTECEALLKKTGRKPPARMLETARRAAFSLHDISREDEEYMRRCLGALVKERREKASFFARLADSYISLLY